MFLMLLCWERPCQAWQESEIMMTNIDSYDYIKIQILHF